MLEGKNCCPITYSPMLLGIRLLICCILFQYAGFAQKFAISFPIGNTIYQESDASLTILIEGVSCDNTVINCHQGIVSMIGRCEYIYRCKKVGLDTVDVFVRKGQKLHRIGQQVFIVKERPLPKAHIAGLEGGVIKKGLLLAQQGLGANWFINGNHWESCTIESFNFIVLRSNKIVSDIHNEGNHFIDDTKVGLQKLEHGDKVLISNIQGCSAQGGGSLKILEFTID